MNAKHQRRPGRRVPTWEWILDLVSFAVALVLAIVLGWEARDLIWGMWICSLCFGYALIVSSLAVDVYRADGSERVKAAVGGVFGLAFFSFHFGFFHFIHGTFLNEFFPLVRGAGFIEFAGFGETIAAALASYWPLVVATFVSRVRELAPVPEVGAPATAGQMPGVDRAYLGVIRMHLLLLFVLAPLHMAGLDRLAIYPVLALYFFPWRSVISVETSGAAGRPGEE